MKVTSRIGRQPIEFPKVVEIKVNEQLVSIKGPKGEMSHSVPAACGVTVDEGVLSVGVNENTAKANALAGTTRALLNNIVTGVSTGFVKKLVLVGVGYRVQLKGDNKAAFSLGLSHPVEYDAPEGVTFVSPSQTELEIHGIDKQKVGQVAANIREFRKPEPYKGKGIRYADEKIIMKETKKK